MTAPLPEALCLLGPTASGKTAVALALARQGGFGIISVDSALVYRGMNIGTAKPDAATLAEIPHGLVDIIDPTASYSAARFRDEALRLMGEIVASGRTPLLVGGTMLYFNALQHGLHELPGADPEVRAGLEREAASHGWTHLHQRLAQLDPPTAARLAPADAQRIQRALEVVLTTGQPLSLWLQARPAEPLPYRLRKVALAPAERSVLHQRIAERFDTMLADGLVDELAGLRQRYPLLPELPSMRCVGYRQAWEYLEGRIDHARLRDTGIFASRQLAKRQLTWLRRMPDLEWVDSTRPEAALAQISHQTGA